MWRSLVSAPALGAGGRGFESRHPDQRDLSRHRGGIAVCLDRQAPTCVTSSPVGDVFKALADPTRRAILDELTDRNGQTLFEICARLTTKHHLGSSRQAISQHLDVLQT